MAVYSAFDSNDFREVVQAYGLGDFLSAEGIPQGSINTNYRLETARGRFFLRHTTVRSEGDLRFEAGLLAHLEESHFPAPQLLRTVAGAPFLALRGGWVTVFRYLAGEERCRTQLGVEQLENLGAELGKLHRVAASYGGSRPNPYGPELVAGWLEELRHDVDPEVAQAGRDGLRALDTSRAARAELTPRGIIHADLFTDNVKWVGDRVSAFFDFEMACVDRYTLDLAITVNAWCFEAGRYDADGAAALVRGYQGERRLSPTERQDVYAQALFGAVRYTASRIRDFHRSPLPPDKLFKKDYRTYLARVHALLDMGPWRFHALLGLA